MYSCFINSTIAQANENNHSSKIAFSPYFSFPSLKVTFMS